MTKRTVALLTGAIILCFSATAQAHTLGARFNATKAYSGIVSSTHKTPRPVCAGLPTQTITVTALAAVQPQRLALVEHAVALQSLELRAKWGTPCVVYGPNGWPLTIRRYVTDPCSSDSAGCHWPTEDGGAAMQVATLGVEASSWSVFFSHEIMEALVDPSSTGLEVCDPLQNTIDLSMGNVALAPFEPPSYFNNHPNTY